MLKSFFRGFEAPIFPDDKSKTRRAFLLHVLLNTFIIALPDLIIGVLLGGGIRWGGYGLCILLYHS